MGVEEAIGTGIAILVISGFILCVVVFAFTALYEHECAYKEKKELEKQKAIEREKADQEKIKNAHKVRTQYPPPQVRQKETSFEVTNIKESILVTEVVYAD